MSARKETVREPQRSAQRERERERERERKRERERGGRVKGAGRATRERGMWSRAWHRPVEQVKHVTNTGGQRVWRDRVRE